MYEKEYHNTPLNDKSFLVTGGSGFIGSNLVEYLLKFGAKKVRVIDNLITGFESNLEKFKSDSRFEFMLGDLRNLEDCEKAVEGMDLISHQAALGSVPRSIDTPHLTNEHNVSGFVNLVQAARKEGVKKIVFASSSSVYGDDNTFPKQEDKTGNALSPYAISKKTMELYAAVFADIYDIDFIGLRYFNVFGPNQSPKGAYAAVIPLFIEGVLNGTDVFINGDGSQSRDFTFVENAVQANVLGLICTNEEAFNQIYNVACGAQLSVLELYQEIKKEIGLDHEVKHREERLGDIKRSFADISKAKKLLGYDPLYDIESGIKISVDYYKNI